MPHTLHHLPPCPYKGMNKELHLSRLSADISYEHKEFLKTILPVNGILNRITQLFFVSLIEEAKYHGIKYYTPENADALGRLIARRCTFVEPAVAELQGPITGGTTGEGHDPAGNLQQSNDTQAPAVKQKSRRKSKS